MREVKQPIIYIVMLLFIACQNVEKNKDLGKESKQNLGMLDQESHREKSVFKIDSCDFECFKMLFKEKVESLQFDDLKSEHYLPNYLNKIPNSVVEEHLNYKVRTGYHIGVFSESIFIQKDDYTGLKYSIPCLGGGTCNDSYLATFTKNGKLISNKIISGEHSDLSNRNIRSIDSVSNNFIRMKLRKKTFSDDDKILKDTVYFEIYLINDMGEIQSL